MRSVSGLSVRSLSGLGMSLALLVTPLAAVRATEGVDAAAAAVTAAPPIEQRGWVTDAADMLTPQQRETLERRLAGLQVATGRETIVVTVPSLHGRDISSYARDLGNRWAVGVPGDEGIVILLAPTEQLVRIAVGRGLEAQITDAMCQDIIDAAMLPEFRAGRLHEGLMAGIAALESGF